MRGNAAHLCARSPSQTVPSCVQGTAPPAGASSVKVSVKKLRATSPHGLHQNRPGTPFTGSVPLVHWSAPAPHSYRNTAAAPWLSALRCVVQNHSAWDTLAKT